MRRKQLKLLKWKKGMKIAGTIALSLAIIAGCSAKQGKNDPAANNEQKTKTVKTAEIAKQKISDPLEQVADVLPIVQLDVSSKATGEVKEVLKKRGEAVNAGDVIVKVDPTDLNLSRQKISLQLKNGEDSLNKAQKDFNDGKAEMANSVLKAERGLQEVTRAFNKMKNDYDLGLVTKADLDRQETQLKNTQLDLDILKQKQKTLETTDSLSGPEFQVNSTRVALEELDRNIANLEVKAPVSGILTDMPIVVGQTLSTGVKVGQIQQTNPVKIKALLTEDSVKLVRSKKELAYYLPGTDVKGKAPIVFLSDVVDAQTKSYEIELEVNNEDAKLKPGMKVQIQLTDDNEQIVVVVPTLSIVRNGGDSFVFVLNGDTVEQRKVQLGRLNDLNQEIISGVKEGETLVVFGQNQLKDKEKVQVSNDSK